MISVYFFNEKFRFEIMDNFACVYIPNFKTIKLFPMIELLFILNIFSQVLQNHMKICTVQEFLHSQ